MTRILKRIKEVISKENNKLKASSRKVSSFYSSLIAGVFVSTGFLFINYFKKVGDKNWISNWIIFLVLIAIFCIVYYFIGLGIISNINIKEKRGYKYNFFAAFIGTVYISAILLFGLKLIVVLISTIFLILISLIILHIIASRKYKTRT